MNSLSLSLCVFELGHDMKCISSHELNMLEDPCIDESAQFCNPISLGSAVGPCRSRLIFWHWLSMMWSLGEIMSLKQASVSPSAENGDNHNCFLEWSWRLNWSTCPQCLFCCCQDQQSPFPHSSWFLCFSPIDAIAYIRGSCKDFGRECTLSSRVCAFTGILVGKRVG